MASGGARSRSGPQPVEGSRTSERKGLVFSALPLEGFSGEVPDLLVFLPEVTDRHSAIWAQLWSTPQACAWAVESWRWPIVADLVKWMVRSDDADSPASIATTVRQLRDDLGLSAAGLKMNGWKVAEPVKAEAADESAGNVTDIKSRLGRGA